ncbi:MAG: TetR/AcrR family transcriptional regulator C-terminal domain-containing protein [Bacilli bacterium]|nr:TetR/AcrR family transcriptional regulator C-terminal domain-containing protein [Bacilli bacterium]
MKTEEKLGEALKELMSKEPLDKITVKRLTTICGINRQTFYYHFRDLYDLLTWIYLNETVTGLDSIQTWNDILLAFCDYVEQNKAFVLNTLSSAGRELFKEFIFNGIYAKYLRVIAYKDIDGVLAVEERKFISRFYTAAFLYSLLNWIDNGMKEDRAVLLNRLSILAEGTIDDAISKFKQAKKR